MVWADDHPDPLYFPCAVRVLICGELRVEGEQRALSGPDLPGRLGRRLWAYLVLNRRRPAGHGELASALWGDDIPDAWEASLHALVSRVRRALAVVADDTALRAIGGGYALTLPAGTFVDRERAWEAIHHVRARQLTGDVRGAWAEAVIAAEIAARGFLHGESGEWIEAERRLLHGIEVQALEAVADADLAGSKIEEAERVARSLVGLDPLRESGYRLLMRSLAAAGNGAAAAAVMEECRRALAAVGANPSAETEAAFRSALGNSSRGDRSGEAAR